METYKVAIIQGKQIKTITSDDVMVITIAPIKHNEPTAEELVRDTK
jgi:hypothetical protein